MTEQQMEAVEGLHRDGVFPDGLLVVVPTANGSVHTGLEMSDDHRLYPLFDHLVYLIHGWIDELADEDDEGDGFLPSTV